jgi:hypothetical protein
VTKSPPVKKSGPAKKPPVKAAKKRRPKPRGARWA